MSRLGVTLVASLVVTALAAPGAGAHDGVETPEATRRRTRSRTRPRRSGSWTRTRAPSRRSTEARPRRPPPALRRTWASGGRSWTGRSIGVHVALLPNGKVLAYDSIGDNATETYPVQDHTRATVWDPATGTQTPVNVDTGFNVFCSGLAHLLDGRLFLAGGNKDQALNGIVQTHLFDPATNTWSLGPNMAAGRWYPTVTPLRNGEMLITSGRVDTPEVRTLAGGCGRSAPRRSACRCTRGWTSRRTGGRSTPVPIRRCASSTRPGPARGRRSVSATRSIATTAVTRSSTSARCSSPAAVPRPTTRGSSTSTPRRRRSSRPRRWPSDGGSTT